MLSMVGKQLLSRGSQVRVRPSFGFVEEPETNGVAERWNRTLKDQAIHGRIFQNLQEVRAAVAEFVELYNKTWRLEKIGYQTPIEAREAHKLRQANPYNAAWIEPSHTLQIREGEPCRSCLYSFFLPQQRPRTLRRSRERSWIRTANPSRASASESTAVSPKTASN